MAIRTSRLAGAAPAAIEDADAALAMRAATDRAAFAVLYHRYVDAVLVYCMRRLGHPDIAADVTSQIFVSALQALPRYRPDARREGSSFRSWLFTIAHNAVIDQYRKHPTSPLPETVDTIADPAESPETQAIARERAQALRIALAELPEAQRAVVELRLTGLKRAEIATVLGLTDAAVRGHQARAFDRLRTLLHEPEEASDATT